MKTNSFETLISILINVMLNRDAIVVMPVLLWIFIKHNFVGNIH